MTDGDIMIKYVLRKQKIRGIRSALCDDGPQEQM